MAGLKVVVLERRAVVGGAAVTEEFHPGFRNSVAAYTVSLLNPKVIADLRLAEHGLRIVERKIANFLPLDDGRYLKVGGGQHARGSREILRRAMPSGSMPIRRGSRRSRTCCARSCWRRRRTSSRGIRSRRSPELIKSGRIANRLRHLGLDLQRELLDLFTNSAGDYLDHWFESAPIKAAYGFDGDRRQLCEPLHAGLGLRAAASLLRRGERQEGRVGPRHRRHGGDHAGDGEGGGRARRRDPRRCARVREVIVEKGRAVGVVTEKGEAIRARAVISNLNPKLLVSAR